MYYFTVSKGLLEQKHRAQMGVALWEFLFCLDRVTKIDMEGRGIVLGGKPVNLSDFAEQFGTSEVTVSRNLQKLARRGYLILVHAPYGIVIKVPKAKKRFARTANPPIIHSFSNSDRAGFIKCDEPVFRSGKPGFINDKPNKRSKDEKKSENRMFSTNEIIERKKLEITQFLKSL